MLTLERMASVDETAVLRVAHRAAPLDELYPTLPS
jgi:hypothetical protein